MSQMRPVPVLTGTLEAVQVQGAHRPYRYDDSQRRARASLHQSMLSLSVCMCRSRWLGWSCRTQGLRLLVAWLPCCLALMRFVPFLWTYQAVMCCYVVQRALLPYGKSTESRKMCVLRLFATPALDFASVWARVLLSGCVDRVNSRCMEGRCYT